ncbi:MAG TPA: hypothetical protein VK932_29775 [Kofleriaceae bacterium]|nr:hypothetical protein [Kofleriaceae bacterium]
MSREAKSPSALIALARTRRMQRALAHAYLHRGAPMPTLRSSLGYMTATACVADGDPQRGHRMRVLGVARREAVVYVVEELGGEDDTPIVYRLWLRGPRQGHLVPLHAWYELADDVRELRARIAALEETLEPVCGSTAEAWMLSTRIVQRRALRLPGPGACADLPIRKFALQLIVEPVSGPGPSGKTTVTAFLRPHAQLAEVWSIGGGDALARISYSGVPSGPGLSKDTVVLLTSGLDAA